MTIPDFTVTLGLDAHTLPYFRTTCPTWKKHYPELWERPWLIFYDPAIQQSQIIDACLGASPTLLVWHGADGGYESQREKMLSGHVYVSQAVETAYSLKIDADAIALERGPWPDPIWFEGRPVLIGPTWGYWRAKGSSMTLVEWCRVLEDFGNRHFKTPEAGWEQRIGSWDHPKGPKLRDKGRFVSWLAFQRVDWVQRMATLFAEDFGAGRLPIPSHDSSLWACAQRSGQHVVQASVKPHWTNRVSLGGCRRVAEQVLRGR